MKLREIGHNCDEEFAVKFLGWKWMSFMTIPIASHPEYGTGKNIRCRRLFSPGELKSKGWQEVFAAKDGREATGEEPLAYAYCSSNGPAMVPVFHLFVEEME